MRRALPALALLAAAGCGSGAADAPSPRPSAPPPVAIDTGQSPILVELFTSQGCHSCPPADDLLPRLAGLADRPVVPLAFHVDYWNGLGWADPFSSHVWSERQRAYAERLSAGRVYTPQLVIHGATHAIGSRRGQVLRGIERAVRDASLQAALELAVATTERTLRVTVVGRLPSHRPLVGYVAVFENGVVTSVPRGENAGRDLRNDFIVRALARFPVQDGPALEHVAAMPIEAGWRRDGLGVAAWLADPDTLRVHGVAAHHP